MKKGLNKPKSKLKSLQKLMKDDLTRYYRKTEKTEQKRKKAITIHDRVL